MPYTVFDTFVDSVLDGNPFDFGNGGKEKSSLLAQCVPEAIVCTKAEMKQLTLNFSMLNDRAMRSINLWRFSSDDTEVQYTAALKAHDDLMHAWDRIFQSIEGKKPEKNMCSLQTVVLNMSTLEAEMTKLYTSYMLFLQEDCERKKRKLENESRCKLAQCQKKADQSEDVQVEKTLDSLNKVKISSPLDVGGDGMDVPEEGQESSNDDQTCLNKNMDQQVEIGQCESIDLLHNGQQRRDLHEDGHIVPDHMHESHDQEGIDVECSTHDHADSEVCVGSEGPDVIDLNPAGNELLVLSEV